MNSISEQPLTPEPQALAAFLVAARKASRLSLAQLAERTKVQTRFLEALEKGELSTLPSATHARAFTLAYARACGADEAQVITLLRQAQGKPSLAPAQASVVAVPADVDPSPASKSRKAEGPIEARPKPMSEGSAHSGTSKPLPRWSALAGLAIAVVATLLGLQLLVGAARTRLNRIKEAPAQAAAVAHSAVAGAAPAAAPAEQAPAAPVAAEAELVLRARRPCWLVLEIDGQRLPTVMLEESEKRRWPVKQKAVLLAGNVGALRVWWRNENLGYLGELGQRANGMVFEVGQPWRKEAVKLALPAGVPE